MRVTVVYATAEAAFERAVELGDGACLDDAIVASGLLAAEPGIDLTRQRVGIFGRLAERDTPLSDGDRVEVYRPLLVDPKEARRRRAGVRRGRA
jgi:uncharacterized protein